MILRREILVNACATYEIAQEVTKLSGKALAHWGGICYSAVSVGAQVTRLLQYDHFIVQEQRMVLAAVHFRIRLRLHTIGRHSSAAETLPEVFERTHDAFW